MTELLHRVKVFVFDLKERLPRYLLVRGDGGLESIWGPVQGEIQFGEQVESAVRREVHSETGIARPVDLIDLQMHTQWLVGDEQIIEWMYGFRSPGPPRDEPDRQLWRWAPFDEAYPSLEFESDRAAIMRLHARLFDVA